MVDYKPTQVSLVFAGPFGNAPYTHPGYVVGVLLPEMKGLTLVSDILADSALGTVYFNTKVGDFSVHASASRFEIEVGNITADNLLLLGRVAERMAGSSPSAMATSIGFNVSYFIEDVSKLGEGLLPNNWLDTSCVLRSTWSCSVDEGTIMNVSITRDKTKGARIDFNFDHTVNQSLQNEAPLIVAKNWCEKTSFEQRIAFCKEKIDKMVRES